VKAVARCILGLEMDIRTTVEGALRLARPEMGFWKPSVLLEAQIAIRKTLLWAEHRQSVLEERRKARKPRIARLRSRVGGMALGEHVRALRVREQLLRRLRTVLRQCGDVLAWRVLEGRQTTIAGLYAKRTHRIPPLPGLLGPVQVMEDAARLGHSLVLDNDITRCLGLGDLTVIPFERPWMWPLSIEIKTSMDSGSPGSLDLVLLTLYSGNSSDEEFQAQFCRDLGMMRGTQGETEADTPQSIKMHAQGGRALQVLAEVSGVRSPPLPSWRDALNELCERALEVGHACVSPEPGMAYFAVLPMRANAAEALKAELDIAGFANPSSGLSSLEFLRDDSLSAVFPPIPMWELSDSARANIMAFQLEIGVLFGRTFWPEVAREFSAELEEVKGAWRIRRGDTVVAVRAMHVAESICSVAFQGHSPRQLVRSLLEGAAADLGGVQSQSVRAG
jgi:hypothetical protein